MIGVVIVTYESADVIGRCLDACSQYPDLRVIVVDNASQDETVAEVRNHKDVSLVVNSQNRGFAGAVNQGVTLCDTDFVLLLNPDTELLTHPARLAAECGGAAGGCLIDDTNTPQNGFIVRAFPSAWTLAFESLGLNRLFPWNPVNRRYRVTLNHQNVTEVDQPAGAFLMIRKEAWARVGGFDEAFAPVWFEDVDFCLRLKRAGFSIRYVPDVQARHVGGHAARKVGWESRQTYWYGSLLKYAAKHFSPADRFLVAGSVWTGALLRLGGELLMRGNLKAVPVYSRVMGFAALTAFSGRGGASGALPGFTVKPSN